VQAQVDLLRNLTQQVRLTAAAGPIGSITAVLLFQAAHASCGIGTLILFCSSLCQMFTKPTKLDAEVLEAASKLLQVRILIQR